MTVGERNSALTNLTWVKAVILAITVLAISYLASSTTIGYDGEQYLAYARNLLSTSTFTYDGVTPSCGRAPGYPAFLSGVLYLSGDLAWVYPLQLLMLFASYCYVAISITESARGRAIVLVLLTLLWPLHRLALGIYSEPLFLLLTASGLHALIRYTRVKHARLLLLAGLLFGASALVRPINLFAIPFLVLILLWRRLCSFRHAALATLVSLLVVTPWTVRNLIVFKQLVPVAAHHGSVYYMTDAEVFWPVLLNSAGYTHSLPIHREIVGDDLELDAEANSRYWQRSRENIKEDPWGFIARCMMKTVFIWTYLPGTKGMIFDRPVLFAIGVLVQIVFLYLSVRWLLRRRATDAGLTLSILGYSLYCILTLFPFYAESRMLIPIYIWLFGGAMIYALPWIDDRRRVVGPQDRRSGGKSG